MARPTIEQLRSFTGLTSTFRWDLSFVKFPSVGAYPSSDDLNLRCTSVTLPKEKVDKTTIEIRGVKVNYPVKSTPEMSISLKFLETEDAMLNKIIDSWRAAIYDFKTGVSGTKKDVEALISLYLLDGNNARIYEYKLIGCFLDSYDRGSPTSSDVKPFDITMTLTFDYFETKAL